MRFFKETTDWGEYNTPNHIYLLTDDKSKAYGYIKLGTEDAFVFKKPYSFDARGRTFQTVKELGEIDLKELQATESKEVVGSKGDKYLVQKIDGVLQCSCPGYTYRGDCRHVKEMV
jgi:hypothetical protein